MPLRPNEASHNAASMLCPGIAVRSMLHAENIIITGQTYN